MRSVVTFPTELDTIWISRANANVDAYRSLYLSMLSKYSDKCCYTTWHYMCTAIDAWHCMYTDTCCVRSINQAAAEVIFLDLDGVLNRTRAATHIRLDEDLLRLLRVL